MPVFNGSPNDDTLNGGSGVDTLNGLGGDDLLRGFGGADTLDGGIGFDIAAYDRDVTNGGGGAVNVNLSTGTAMDGFGATDTLISIEFVIGTALADSFTGSDRTDDSEHYRGLAGNDTIDGRGGWDEVRYDRDANAGGTAAVNVNLATGIAIDGFGNTDTLSNIEAARGSASADTFTGNNGDNEFRGLGGNDTINAGGGFDVLRYDSDAGNGGTAGITANFTGAGVGTVTDGFGATDTFTGVEGIRGTASGDRFNGSNVAAEDFFGLAGNDTLNGGTGTSFDWARYDRDSVSGGMAGVTANLATGTATDGFGNTDSLISIEGLRGTAFADSLTGDAGRNRFSGGAGNDTITGGNGQDLIFYNTASDRGPNGINANLATGIVIDGFGNSDSVSGIEEIIGTDFNDTILGSNRSDILSGNFGADSLNGGGGGFDFMRGGIGNDTLNGTAGTGTFRESSFSDQDTAAYNDGGPQGINANLVTGIVIDGFGNTDTLFDIERIRGSNFNDTMLGSNTQNLRQERFEGLGGADSINGQAGYDVVRHDQDVNNGGTAGITVNLATGTATDGFGATDTLANIEGVIATRMADSLTGAGTNNVFRTMGGNDTIDGAGGIDAIDLYVTDLIGGAGANVNLSTGTGTQIGGGTLTFSSIEVLLGSSSNDTFLGSTGADVLNGELGNDSLVGGDGDDTINGGAGVDTLAGGGGDDWLSFIFDSTYPAQNLIDAAGNAEFGWLSQNWNWTGVTANLATGTMSGIDGAVDAFSGFENVAGTYLADNLTGDGNANRFRGYSGNDTIDGGGGSDTIVYSTVLPRNFDVVIAGIVGDRPLAVNANLTTGFVADGNGGTDIVSNIENVVGSSFDDTIVGNAAENRLDGGLGADFMQGLAGNDTYVVDNAGDVVSEFGGTGDDTVFSSITYALTADVERLNLTGMANINATGNDLANVIFGNAGNNIINGGLGADQMNGGLGDDTYVIDSASDSANEAAGAGNDLVQSSISFQLRDNVERLTLTGSANVNATGNALSNVLTGNSGNNILDGGTGADAMIGGAGNDRYTFDNIGDTASELAGEGLDTVIASVAHTLRDNFENLTIIGSATNAFGSSVANILTGNALGNLLNGKEASDILTGGAGLDTFMFDTALGAANVDRITDFNPVDDAFRLASAIFTGIGPGLLGTTAFRAGTSATETTHRIIYDQTTGRVFFDADGVGGAAQVLFALLDTRPVNVTNADFVIV